MTMPRSIAGADSTYEWKAIALLGLGFGLVGLDRWIIAPLFPAMMQDLKLTYADLGNLIGVLGFTWGICSILLGNLSDRIGRRIVLVPALVAFSLMAGFSGAVSSVLALLCLRAVMGATEGAYLATSTAAAGEASLPRRRGLNQGLMLSAFPLFGMALAPIIATRLLGVLPSWRWVFVLVAIPGIVLAVFMWRVIREPAHLEQGVPRQPLRWLESLRSRNVVLAMLSLVCAMSCVFVLASMVPSYLQDYLKLAPAQMGLVMSGLGFGGFAGEWLVCATSDYVGRRSMAVVSFVGALLSVYMFRQTGAEPLQLFVGLFLASFFSFGILGLMTGPVATEGVPPPLIASAIGLVSGAGEICGGGAVPAIAGHIAQSQGIQNSFQVSFVGLAIGILVSLFFVETAPRRKTARAVPRALMILSVVPLCFVSAPSRGQSACDRACLESIADQYRAAYVTRNAKAAAISGSVRFTENNVEMRFPDGSWDAVTAEVGPALTFSDPKTGNVGFTTTVMMNDTPGFLAVRLRVKRNRIVEIEHMLSTRRGVSGPPTPFGDVTKFAHDSEMNQFLQHSERVPRVEMTRQADAYFSTLSQNDGTLRGGVKFAPNCHRMENGQEFAAAGCDKAFLNGNYRFNERVRDREYFLIDEDRGLVFCRAFIDHKGVLDHYRRIDGPDARSPFREPHTWSVMELFKVKNGELGPIEAVFVGVAYRTRTAWTKHPE
jgi:predicted MFS family arabinose efflux permease